MSYFIFSYGKIRFIKQAFTHISEVAPYCRCIGKHISTRVELLMPTSGIMELLLPAADMRARVMGWRRT